MEVTWTDDPATLARVITIRLDMDAIADLVLSPFDHAFVRECESSDRLSDKLLLLEFFARKLESQAHLSPISQPL